MIYGISDIHGDIEGMIKQCSGLTRDDYVIVTGDVGFFQETQKILLGCEFAFTLLFLDGNHEDFGLLNSYEVTEYCGGKVHKIAENIYHLLRGQVFQLKTKDKIVKIAVLGGGESRDKAFREENVDWFSAEGITEEDLIELNKNLKKHNYQVDYFFSHIPSAILKVFLYNTTYHLFLEKNKGNFSNYQLERLSRLKYSDSEYRVYMAIEGVGRPPLTAKTYYCGHDHLFRGEYKIKKRRYIILSQSLQRLQ